MSSLAFVTHPSVRIKGTENSYTPSQCLDDRCPVKAPHLHCPFCVKTDAYQDPVILKAHYRVKHVDKGIEFAGLKILRCCDQCDIIGIIKGEKRFKGAHWHCYRCRNGFNRRDEAIKHYKTHFRNPQTTFQIQITQDLNSPPEVRPHDDHNTASQDAFASIENPVQEIIHPALSQTAITIGEQNVITTGTGTNRHGGTVQKIKVKHELLEKEDDSGDHEDEETIMIIQGDQLESAFASHIINSGELTALNKTGVDPNLSWEIRYRMEEEEKNIYKSKAEEYKAQVELLQQQVADLETQLVQQSQLKLQELIENLSSGDLPKQGLGQQLSKFLERCQPQPSQCSVSVVENQPKSQSQREQLVSVESINQELENSNNPLSNQLDIGRPVSQELESNSTVSVTGVNHLSEIPEGFQVICTTSEGHMVVTRAPDSVVTPPVGDGVAGVVSENRADSNSVSVISAAGTVSETSHSMFAHLLESQNKEILTGDVLPEVSSEEADQGLMSENGMPQEGHVDLASIGSGQDCLMEVVTAADGLASLGTDVTVVGGTATDQEGQFVMEMEDGQRIFVQQTHPETDVNVVEGQTLNEEGTESKRARIT